MEAQQPDRLWPTAKNGHACPECGTLMVNSNQASICLKCGRTHEGRLKQRADGGWVLA